MLSAKYIQILNEEFTREDVKKVIFNIPDEKALGEDDFNSKLQALLGYNWS